MTAASIPLAYESRKLTAAEQAHPPHALALRAVARALRVSRHCGLLCRRGQGQADRLCVPDGAV